MAGHENSGDCIRINIRDFLKQWTDVLTPEDITGNLQGDQTKYMEEKSNIDARLLSELDVVCGMETLNCPDEPRDKSTLLSMDAQKVQELDFVSTKFHADNLEKRKDVPFKRSWLRAARYRDRHTPWVHRDLLAQSSEVKCTTHPEVLITIEILRPFRRGKHCKTIIDQEVQVLGSHRLTQFRDVISCLSDNLVPGDCSEIPNVQPEIKTKDVYKSGYFFIDDTFYSDVRDPSQKDFSKMMCDWAKKENVIGSHIDGYEAKSMDDTCFMDLTVCLGYPYLYHHQGTCEHLIAFSDIRILSDGHCRDLSKYPLTTLQIYPKKIWCRVCLQHNSKWVTRNSSLSPEDPCFYCNTCFQAFHYDIYGNKLFDFQAYHYPNVENS